MSVLQRIAEARLPTPFAEFRVQVFGSADGKEHVVMALGDLETGDAPLVRIHSECLTGDALFSLRCDCGFQLEAALAAIAKAGCGAVLYLKQEGRGIGLGNKIRAYALQDQGSDTVEANHQLGFPADAREYDLAVQLLKELGLARIRLMTNNPRKHDALVRDGIEIVERVPLQSGRNPHNEAYLRAKADKLGHWLTLP
ncbi:GTP cyclohydrolase II [Panacagrimonas perspica]|uniref:GTP cyclohydrolase-2 n=1 Tax=Panacagrimonas perspica TaxID=381431 RepID=A0A4S3K840_9GAMM|nr:GTP cyclohydrolase II [Panacagrimonas perspica]TDU32064.1 GTP cyclohydrolase II [Panacagrimonas perspica]THD04407.1 GTP cyclohydrolase II [Panacagrimonas perspica]